MNCAEARLLIGANPRDRTPALEEHLRACESCRTYHHEMIMFDDKIRRALSYGVMIPPRSAASKPHSPPLRWALAASLVIGLGAAAVLWTLQPVDALAIEVVAHVAAEPDSWSRIAPLPKAELDPVLRQAGIMLDTTAGDVVYARTCEFRGRTIPHFVVRTAEGPVTVLVLAGETVPFRRHFSEEGYAGVLVPASSGGAVAVLARGTAQVDEAARRMMTALHWGDPTAGTQD